MTLLSISSSSSTSAQLVLSLISVFSPQTINYQVASNSSAHNSDAQLVLNPDNIWAIMQEIRNATGYIQSSLSQVDWNVFMPVSSESVLENLAQDHVM